MCLYRYFVRGNYQEHKIVMFIVMLPSIKIGKFPVKAENEKTGKRKGVTARSDLSGHNQNLIVEMNVKH